jgi:hypothetical protein
VEVRVLVIALFAGCHGRSAISTFPGFDSGFVDSGLGPCSYAGPVLISSVDVGCDESGAAAFLVETDGISGDGLLFAEATGGDAPDWSETHTVVSFERDDCGAWDHLGRTLVTGVTEDAWAEDQSTAFTCDGDLDGNGMSYAAMVYDADGTPADCVAWGEDPAAVIDGNRARANEPGWDLAGCVILR